MKKKIKLFMVRFNILKEAIHKDIEKTKTNANSIQKAGK
jgi:hypothetical protein